MAGSVVLLAAGLICIGFSIFGSGSLKPSAVPCLILLGPGCAMGMLRQRQNTKEEGKTDEE